MGTQRHTWKPLGIDITRGVHLRMITPDERASIASGLDILADFEETICSRLPVSLRDEAIWQYHLKRRKGIVRWCANGSFLYIPETEYLSETRWNAIPALLAGYDPAREALVMVEHTDLAGLFRIEADGQVTLLNRAPNIRSDQVTRSESESLQER